jgi:hypothetical protein
MAHLPSHNLRIFVSSLLIFSILFLSFRLLLDYAISVTHFSIEFCRRPVRSSLIFIAVMTGSLRRSIIDIQWSHGLSSVASDLHVVAVEYYGCGANPISSARHVDIKPRLFPNDHSLWFLCSKLLVAIERFLDTPARWLLRICDDSFVDLNAFRQFLTELTNSTDPFAESIIQGHMIQKSFLRHAYPQGGFGIVFSRLAAQQIRSDFPQFVRNCRSNCNDDRATGIWIQNHGIPAGQTMNRWFVGHSFRQSWIALQIPNRLQQVEKCPPEPPANSGLRRFFHRVRDIAFWHAREDFHVFGPNASRLKQELPENLFFFVDGSRHRLCFGNGTRAGYFDDTRA